MTPEPDVESATFVEIFPDPDPDGQEATKTAGKPAGLFVMRAKTKCIFKSKHWLKKPSQALH